ncbi:MAG TPA: glycosyltransferase [Pyrinomonadaceae bacterium]|jgi:glycosyltransferase involved in cell wall biosynthesis|nr:glycosyltransferase [Pyrinomonadaceae bacterium]
MITIMHVVDLVGPNPWLNGVADHYDRTRFRHLVVSLGPRAKMHEALEERGITTFALDAPARKQLPKAIRRLTTLLRREQVDILQTHTFYPTMAGLLAAKVARTPLTILTRHHADFTTLFNKPIHRRIDRWHASMADEIWSPSEFIKQCMVRYEGVPEERITVLWHGFDFELMKPRLSDEEKRALREEAGGDANFLIGTLARLNVEKGHEYLLQAVPGVVKEHPEVRFLIIGAGPRREELEAMVAELGIGDYVKFLGWRWDAWNLIEAMDMIAHPSLHEPFGIIYVESMALQKAVITTNESASPEIIDDGETGVIVPPRDSEALKSAILDVMHHPKRAEEMGREARIRAMERFNFPKMMKEYEQYYVEWLNRKSPQRRTASRRRLQAS